MAAANDTEECFKEISCIEEGSSYNKDDYMEVLTLF